MGSLNSLSELDSDSDFGFGGLALTFSASFSFVFFESGTSSVCSSSLLVSFSDCFGFGDLFAGNGLLTVKSSNLNSSFSVAGSSGLVISGDLACSCGDYLLAASSNSTFLASSKTYSKHSSGVKPSIFFYSDIPFPSSSGLFDLVGSTLSSDVVSSFGLSDFIFSTSSGLNVFCV